MFQTPTEIVGAQCSGRRVSGGVLAGDGYFRGGRGERESFSGMGLKRRGGVISGLVWSFGVTRFSFFFSFFFLSLL